MCVHWLPVDSDVQATTIFTSEQGIGEGEGFILLQLHGKLDGWSHTVEMVQESFCCALIHDAGCACLHEGDVGEVGSCGIDAWGERYITYIGETVRKLETRMKEHRDACVKGM